MTVNVVITGLGATTPLGGDVASTWDGVVNGRTGVRRLEADWVEEHDLPAKLGAPLAVEPSEVLPAKRRMDWCEPSWSSPPGRPADAGFELPTRTANRSNRNASGCRSGRASVVR